MTRRPTYKFNIVLQLTGFFFISTLLLKSIRLSPKSMEANNRNSFVMAVSLCCKGVFSYSQLHVIFAFFLSFPLLFEVALTRVQEFHFVLGVYKSVLHVFPYHTETAYKIDAQGAFN